MDESMVFAIASRCFAPVDSETWAEAVRPDVWRSFVESLDRLSDDSGILSDSTETPPTFEEKQRFAASHFTGGLPVSAPPVESLYYYPEDGIHPRQYLQESALYMDDLLSSLGFGVPSGFSSCPDHLCLELEVASHLFDQDPEKAVDFVCDRFSWLDRYKEELASIGIAASFYVGVVEGLIHVRDALCKRREDR